MESEIQSLYIRYFGRPADFQGLDFWVQSRRQGQTINEIKSLFERSPEFLRLYSDQRPERIVERAYDYLFGRTPDLEGLRFWSNHLSTGRLSLNTILDTLIDSAVANDRSTLNARVEASNAFTSELRRQGLSFDTGIVHETGRSWLGQVNLNADSQELAMAQLPVLIPRLNGIEPALVDEEIASSLRSMLSRLGSNPTLRIFYNLSGSDETRLPLELTPQPINDELLSVLRTAFSRIDSLVERFELTETSSLANADIEVHASSGFPNNIGGQATSSISTRSGSNVTRVYSRIDVLPESGLDMRYLVGHEILHAFGGEHPFDDSDGDSLGMLTTNDTLLSYEQSPLAIRNGYSNIFTPLDDAVIRSIFI